MTSQLIFTFIVVAVAVELIILTRISARNVRFLDGCGTIAVPSNQLYGRLNIALRTTWLIAMMAEVFLLDRMFVPAVAVVAVVVTVVALWLRIAAMRALGRRWTLPSIAVPGAVRVSSGPYRYLSHPNWLGVILEIVSIPLIHGAYFTAAVFLLLELLLLSFRAKAERELIELAEQNIAIPEQNPALPVCIIGAGAAGLAMARAFQKTGQHFEIFDKGDAAGGLWAAGPDGSLMPNTHIISPKAVQAFTDRSMPDHFADYPSHKMVATYLADYAAHYQITSHVHFNTDIVKVTGDGDGYLVEFGDGTARTFAQVVIATGHNEVPVLPDFVGAFDGTVLHSCHYSGIEQILDKKALVVGCGQSSMDMLIDAATVCKSVDHSTRRPFICVPRYVFGKPLEELLDKPPAFIHALTRRMKLDRFFRNTIWLSRLFMRLGGDRGDNWGVPAIGKRAVLPTMDQKVYSYYAQGDITHRPDIDFADGSDVVFADGTREKYDIVLCGTGYEITYPFLDPRLIPTPSGNPGDLFHHMLHRTELNLFFVGIIHPIGSHWSAFEKQASVVAQTLLARARGIQPEVDWLKRSTDEIDLLPTDSQGIKVNKHRYQYGLDYMVSRIQRQAKPDPKKQVEPPYAGQVFE